jgi:hypothetical protein
MSQTTEPLELAGAARAALTEIRRMLMAPKPENIESCCGELKRAIAFVQRLTGLAIETNESVRRREELRVEAEELRRELAQAGRLLHQAGGFYLGWARLLLAAGEAYTPDGEATPLPVVRRLSVEG